MDGVGGLLRGLGGDNQRISDRVACTESLGVVHALDMNREAVSINERHGARALHNLVLKASPPNRVVLCIGTLAACEARVGCGRWWWRARAVALRFDWSWSKLLFLAPARPHLKIIPLERSEKTCETQGSVEIALYFGRDFAM